MTGAGRQLMGWGLAGIGLILLLRSPLGPAVGALLAILLVFGGGVLAVLIAWQFATGRYGRSNHANQHYATAFLPASAAPMLIQRGLARLHQGDYEAAITDFSKAIPLNPDSADLYNNRGFARLQLGNYPAALKDLNQAIRLNAQLISAYVNRGNVRYHLADLAGSLADYDRAIQLEPAVPNHYLRRGLVHAAMGTSATAIADFAQALQLGFESDQDSATTHCYWGVSLNSLGDYQAAIDHCNQAIQLNPNLVQAYDVRGTAHSQLGDYHAALIDFDQSIQLNPHNLPSYLHRGGLRLHVGQLEGAIADCDYVIQQLTAQQQPAPSPAHFLCGIASAYAGNYQRALAEFDQLVQLEPESSNTYYNLGVVQYLLQLYPAAIASLTTALQLEPNFVAAYYIRGNAYCGQGGRSAALADFRQATQLEAMGQGTLVPEDEHGFYGRSLARYRGHNHRGAIADLNQTATICRSHHNHSLLRRVTLLRDKWQGRNAAPDE